MSPVEAWLGGRRPGPPEDLGRRVAESVASEATETPETELSDHLLEAARGRLRAALARPGRVRDTAFELLVADALVTYACEAALESERPVETLRRLVEVGRRA